MCQRNSHLRRCAYCHKYPPLGIKIGLFIDQVGFAQVETSGQVTFSIAEMIFKDFIANPT